MDIFLNNRSHTGIVLLAAGSSKRLGQPKQLLCFNEKTLIRRMAEIALAVTEKVVVVTGAESAAASAELEGLPVVCAFNNLYQEGIASSIRKGLSSLLIQNQEIENVLLLVCDQPFVSVGLLKKLVRERQKGKKQIVACIYDEVLGTPALFGKHYFTNLLDLQGDSGAKKIIQQHLDDVAIIPFPKGSVDIDTQEDYDRLLQ